MSGIAAIFSPTEPFPPEALARAREALRHRGPHGGGSWIGAGGRVGLAHRRLGPGAADQPLADESGRVRIVRGGHAVGTAPQRRELEARGHRFRTDSDAEVVAALYREWGTACLERVRGELTFALWDDENRVLFAARDRFGARPLFYARIGDTLYLASEAKALFAAGVPAAWDEESVYQQLFVCLEDDRSLFRGVRAVPPGCFLHASAGHVRIQRYWDLDYPRPGEGPPLPDDGEVMEEIRTRLREAVRLRMDGEGDGPVGFFLSGGVDSSIVLGLGASVSSEPVTAFTVTFAGERAYDETAAARISAERAGARFHEIPVSRDELADALADAVAQGEMLGLNAHGVARYVQSRAVRDAGYHAALSGEGSDDLFAGYPTAKEDMIRQRAATEREPPGSARGLGAVARRLGFVPAWMRKVALGRSVFHALLDPGYAASFAGRDPYAVFLDRCDVTGQLTGREPVIQSLYLWSKAFLAGYALTAERLAMGFSVEERVPFMDHRLFDLVRRLPASLLIRDMKEKWVLREAARPLLSESTYRRPKHSFAAPPALVTPGNRLYDRMRDTLAGDALETVPFFDPAAVRALVDRLPEMPASTRVSLEPVLLMTVCACLLHERYGL